MRQASALRPALATFVANVDREKVKYFRNDTGPVNARKIKTATALHSVQDRAGRQPAALECSGGHAIGTRELILDPHRPQIDIADHHVRNLEEAIHLKILGCSRQPH